MDTTLRSSDETWLLQFPLVSDDCSVDPPRVGEARKTPSPLGYYTLRMGGNAQVPSLEQEVLHWVMQYYGSWDTLGAFDMVPVSSYLSVVELIMAR